MFGKKKYDHSKKNIYDACGIAKEELDEKIKKLNNFYKEMDKENLIKRSKIVEKIETLFTKKELALVTYLLNYKTSKQSFDKSKHPEFV